MTTPRSYLRPDGVRMLEVAPGQFVSEPAALALGLGGPRSEPRRPPSR